MTAATAKVSLFSQCQYFVLYITVNDLDCGLLD